MNDDSIRDTKRHYSPENLLEGIRAALLEMGVTPETVTLDHLATLDEFHIRGRKGTLELFELLQPTRPMHLLDIGAGLGGPARVLATQYCSTVTGLDLSKVFVEAGNELSEWLDLSDQVRLVTGNALDMPFDDGSFNAAFTIHTLMNIENKPALITETARVLKPGAKLAMFETFTGDGGEIHFPLPWADRAEIDFTGLREALESELTDNGFSIEAIVDATPECTTWIENSARRVSSGKGLPPLGLNLLLGESFVQRVQNFARNLKEGRLSVARVVAARDA